MGSVSQLQASGQPSEVVRFGPFEFDRTSGEIRKEGTRIRLQPKSVQVLCALLDKPGEIVSREELKSLLWPGPTLVDLENGLNTAVNRLRIALGDSAEYPRFIATEARSGYRFIAPVQAHEPPRGGPVEMPHGPAAVEPPVRRSRRRLLWIIGACLALVIALTAVVANRPATPESGFRQITFKRGNVTGARFGGDSQAIFYTAQWGNEPRRIHQLHVGDPVSRALGFENLSLVAVSRSGSLAVMRSGGTMNIRGGTLFRTSVDGGPIERIADGIFGADWSPDGANLALVRVVAGAQQLEFPPGRVLYRTSGWLSNSRVSPAGDAVAFIEHPVRHDDAGSVRLVDQRGTASTLSEGWASASGLAWRSRSEVYFTASRGNGPRSVWGVTIRGSLRPIGQAPGGLTLRDIAPDGRVLLSVESRRLEMAGSVAGEAEERDLSLTDWSRVQQISADGSLLLFDEGGEGVGWRTVTYIRNLRSGEIVRLREGIAQGFDANASAAIILSEDRARLYKAPVSGKPPEEFATSGLTYQWARPFPDGKKLLALANRPKQPLQLYIQDAESGKAEALTGPMMVRNASASPDGQSVAVLTPEGVLEIYETAGHQKREIASNEPLAPIRWSNDGRWLYVMHLAASVQSSARISRLDASTGQLSPWKLLKPSDTIGVNAITGVSIADDERSYVYSYRRVLSELYLAEGWR